MNRWENAMREKEPLSVFDIPFPTRIENSLTNNLSNLSTTLAMTPFEEQPPCLRVEPGDTRPLFHACNYPRFVDECQLALVATDTPRVLNALISGIYSATSVFNIPDTIGLILKIFTFFFIHF